MSSLLSADSQIYEYPLRRAPLPCENDMKYVLLLSSETYVNTNPNECQRYMWSRRVTHSCWLSPELTLKKIKFSEFGAQSSHPTNNTTIFKHLIYWMNWFPVTQLAKVLFSTTWNYETCWDDWGGKESWLWTVCLLLCSKTTSWFFRKLSLN